MEWNLTPGYLIFKIFIFLLLCFLLRFLSLLSSPSLHSSFRAFCHAEHVLKMFFSSRKTFWEVIYLIHKYLSTYFITTIAFWQRHLQHALGTWNYTKMVITNNGNQYFSKVQSMTHSWHSLLAVSGPSSQRAIQRVPLRYLRREKVRGALGLQ